MSEIDLILEEINSRIEILRYNGYELFAWEIRDDKTGDMVVKNLVLNEDANTR